MARLKDDKDELDRAQSDFAQLMERPTRHERELLRAAERLEMARYSGQQGADDACWFVFTACSRRSSGEGSTPLPSGTTATVQPPAVIRSRTFFTSMELA